MANSNSATSLLGILAVIVLVGLVVYFIVGGEVEDDDLEIEIGLAREVPVDVTEASFGPSTPPLELLG